MTFENFAKLTNVTLLNSPSISSFEKIELEAKRVSRGDLFIGDDKDEINLALKNEAYAIVSQNPDITDKEIAWFQTDSIDDVIVRLLKYFIIEKKLTLIYAKDQEIELIKKIADKENLLFFTKLDLKTLYNATSENFIFCSDEELLKQIAPSHERLKKSKSKFEVTKRTLFLTNFIYKQKIFQNIKIPYIFINSLENTVSFLDEKSINFDIDKCNFTSHFHPIFIDKKLDIKPFGKSEQVIICERDKSLINEELLFLQKEAPWAKVVKIDNYKELKNLDFNFAIICKDYEQLVDELNSRQNQALLF